MTASTTTPQALEHEQPRRDRGDRLWSSSRVWIPGSIIVLFVLAAVIGPMLDPHHNAGANVLDRLIAPGGRGVDGTFYLLGTDQVGRPMLTELMAGARVSILVAASTVLIGGGIGLVAGLVAGYVGGWFDALVMRLGDIQLAFPSILLAIIIAGVIGPSVTNVILTLAITRWVVYARVVRASALVARKLEYVEGAKVIGASPLRIMRRHVFPQAIGPLLVVGAVEVGQMVIAEASLSFLGLGVPASVSSWGSLISDGRDYLDTAWWIATFPGIAMVILVVCVGLLGDAFHHHERSVVSL